MLAPRLRGALFFWLAAISAACGGGTEPNGGTNPPLTPLTSVRIISGNGQIGAPGTALSSALSLHVLKNQAYVANATVTFAVVSGSASVSPVTVTTDTSGRAATNVMLGATPGPVVITATVAGTDLAAVFTIGNGTTSGTATSACQSATPTTPAAGGVITDLTGTGICLGGGTSGAQYALVAFYGNPDSSQTADLRVRSTGGVTQIATASQAPAFNAGPTLANARLLATNTQAAFSAHLRGIARRELTSKIPAARLAAQRGASFTTIPANPAIGTLVSLNAQGND
ncbi:MAG: hypothetical protein ABI205_11125, partial [Gemmatimonadaceae bacterium]